MRQRDGQKIRICPRIRRSNLCLILLLSLSVADHESAAQQVDQDTKNHGQKEYQAKDIDHHIEDNTMTRDQVTVSISETGTAALHFSSPEERKGFRADFNPTGRVEQVCSYIFLPWQNLFEKTSMKNDDFPDGFLLETVTTNAIVYKKTLLTGNDKTLVDCLDRVTKYMDRFLEIESNNRLITKDEGLTLLGQLQVISLREYESYVVVEMALPGTKPAYFEDISAPFPRKMVLLRQLPDMGPIKTNWISPGGDYDTNKFNNIGSKLKEDFQVKEALPLETDFTEQLWMSYQPKATPDDLLDYDPGLLAQVNNLPEAALDNLPALLERFRVYEQLSNELPGRWEEGNILLGAKDREYRPSEAELLRFEAGRRIESILKDHNDSEIQMALLNYLDLPTKLKFTKFSFIHYDVMGSGRFFYIDNSEEVIVDLSRFK